MLKPINFTVENFEICPIKGDDLDRFDIMADEVYDILSDEQTLRYIPEKRLNNKQEAIKWLQASTVNFYTGRNFIHLIRHTLTGKIVGIIDVLSPALVMTFYRLSSYPYFLEFYVKAEFQGDSVMSKILPVVLQKIKKQNINTIAAVADKGNVAARKLLEKSGFSNIQPFDLKKDLFELSSLN